MKFSGGHRYALQCRSTAGNWQTIGSCDDATEMEKTLDEGGRRGTSLTWRIYDRTTDAVVKELPPTKWRPL